MTKAEAYKRYQEAEERAFRQALGDDLYNTLEHLTKKRKDTTQDKGNEEEVWVK